MQLYAAGNENKRQSGWDSKDLVTTLCHLGSMRDSLG